MRVPMSSDETHDGKEYRIHCREGTHFEWKIDTKNTVSPGTSYLGALRFSNFVALTADIDSMKDSGSIPLCKFSGSA
jgi:hypothetical protein